MRTYNLNSTGALALNSSGGQLLKWHINNKFIKTSCMNNNIGYNSFLYNSYAEVIAYHIATWFGMEHLKYQLCKVNIDEIQQTIACESSDFTYGNYEYLSMGKMLVEGLLRGLPNSGASIYYWLVDLIEQVVPGFKYYLDSMIVLDSIILNDDRHLGNFGLMRNKRDGKFLVPPIFDSGNSLFCHKDIQGIEYTNDMHTLIKCRPFSIFWDQQLRLVVGYNLAVPQDIQSKIHGLLSKLVATQELPEYRAIFIEKLLINRLNTVKDILE